MRLATVQRILGEMFMPGVRSGLIWPGERPATSLADGSEAVTPRSVVAGGNAARSCDRSVKDIGQAGANVRQHAIETASVIVGSRLQDRHRRRHARHER